MLQTMDQHFPKFVHFRTDVETQILGRSFTFRFPLKFLLHLPLVTSQLERLEGFRLISAATKTIFLDSYFYLQP